MIVNIDIVAIKINMNFTNNKLNKYDIAQRLTISKTILFKKMIDFFNFVLILYIIEVASIELL